MGGSESDASVRWRVVVAWPALAILPVMLALHSALVAFGEEYARQREITRTVRKPFLRRSSRRRA